MKSYGVTFQMKPLQHFFFLIQRERVKTPDFREVSGLEQGIKRTK